MIWFLVFEDWAKLKTLSEIFPPLKLNYPLEMMKDTVWPFSLIQDQMQFWSLLKYFEKMAKSHSIRPNWLDTRE
jgi:hypothetical protein